MSRASSHIRVISCTDQLDGSVVVSNVYDEPFGLFEGEEIQFELEQDGAGKLSRTLNATIFGRDGTEKSKKSYAIAPWSYVKTYAPNSGEHFIYPSGWVLYEQTENGARCIGGVETEENQRAF
jgi:hypothetical protein